jgi:hypothetical protein
LYIYSNVTIDSFFYYIVTFNKTNLFEIHIEKEAAMTKEDQRIRDFASGIKKLGGNSQKAILRLAHALLLVEHSLPVEVLGKKIPEVENKHKFMGVCL